MATAWSAFGEVARHKPASIAEADEWFARPGGRHRGRWPSSTTGRRVPGWWPSAASSSIRSAPRGSPRWSSRRRSSAGAHGRSWLTRIGPDRGRGVSPGVDAAPRIGPMPAPAPAPEPPRGLRFGPGGLDEASWPAAVAEAVRRIADGHVGQGGPGAGRGGPGRQRPRPALAGRTAGRRLPPVLDLPGRRAGGGEPGDAGQAGGRPGPVPGAGRDHPADRRRRPRPQPGGGAGQVQQGPERARVRGGLGGPGAVPVLLRDERARGAVRARAAQRAAPGHRRDRGGRAAG